MRWAGKPSSLRAYREEGIPIEHIHVQNEPDSDQKFPSCQWTGAEMLDYIRDHLGLDLMWHFLQHGVEAYIYWNLCNTPQSISTWGWTQNAMISLEPETGTVCYHSEFNSEPSLLRRTNTLCS